MKPDEWPAVAQRLDAAYPGFADDPQTSAVYIDVLADIDSAAVDQAVTELLREGREHPPPPGVIRARALGEPQAPPSDPGQTTRDRGARRGLGWVGVLALIALGLGVAGLIVAIANNNEDDSPTITRTEVNPELTVTTPEPAPSESAPSESAPSDATPGDGAADDSAAPDAAPAESPSTTGSP